MLFPFQHLCVSTSILPNCFQPLSVRSSLFVIISIVKLCLLFVPCNDRLFLLVVSCADCLFLLFVPCDDSLFLLFVSCDDSLPLCWPLVLIVCPFCLSLVMIVCSFCLYLVMMVCPFCLSLLMIVCPLWWLSSFVLYMYPHFRCLCTVVCHVSAASCRLYRHSVGQTH